MRKCKSIDPQYMREFRVNSYKARRCFHLCFTAGKQLRMFIFLLSGGVDNCVKLWNARSICNPDDDDDEGTDPK